MSEDHDDAATPGLELVPFVHASGMTIGLPGGWELLEDAGHPVVLVTLEPDQPARTGVGFRANLVVTLDDVTEGVDLDAWQAGTERLLAQTLQDYLVIDLERTALAELPAIRRLAHHRTDQGRSVTMEQWTVVLPHQRGWTLTASVATPAYASLTDMFADVAAGWRPPGHPGPHDGARGNDRDIPDGSGGHTGAAR